MSDHDDLKQFLNSLTNMLDIVERIVYTARCKIRVEQELVNHDNSLQEEVSGPSKTDALPVVSRQGGPELFPGTPKERSRSQNAAETVLMRGGRMETEDGRS